MQELRKSSIRRTISFCIDDRGRNEDYQMLSAGVIETEQPAYDWLIAQNRNLVVSSSEKFVNPTAQDERLTVTNHCISGNLPEAKTRKR
jgi:hypothetical protein